RVTCGYPWPELEENHRDFVENAHVVDLQHGVDGHFVTRIYESVVDNCHRLKLVEGDGVLDSEGHGVQVLEEADGVQHMENVSILNLNAHVHALKNQVALIEKSKVDEVSNPNVGLFSTNAEMSQPWFIASVDFIKVENAHVVDLQHGVDGHFVTGIYESVVDNCHHLKLVEGDGVLDSEGHGVQVLEEADDVQHVENVSILNLNAHVHALKNQVALIEKTKVDEVDDVINRLSKIEILLNLKLQNVVGA
nr:hypothetical protein [Tanacetum cinerariifolium]